MRDRQRCLTAAAAWALILIGGAVQASCQRPTKLDSPDPVRDFTYAVNPAIYTKGVAIAPNVPSSTGIPVRLYAVEPRLPAGLSLDPDTGVISGTPASVTAAADYTVTAFNSGGHTTVVLNLTVYDVPPAGLVYATNPAVYTKGSTIPDNAPSSAGGPVTLYTVDPPLPAGVTLNAFTGVVSGTPTVLAPTASYTVTASNSGGSTTAVLVLAVNDVLPSLAYALNPAAYVKGRAIPDNRPSNSGGAVLSYAVAPPLPAGLSLDPSTGVVSGTPLQVADTAVYTITATNSGGSAGLPLTLTVALTDVPPSNLVYAANPVLYTTGVAIGPNLPASSGGPVVSYTVTPPLPSGLMLDAGTGVISGTPSAITAAATYTIRGENPVGSTTADLRITVNPPPPDLATPLSDQTAYLGQTATFTVAAVGTGPLDYQWFEDGLAIGGATSATYTTPVVTPVDVRIGQADLSVLVSDGYGQSATFHATLRMPSNFTSGGELTTERQDHTATLLPNGLVLMVGGTSAGASAELYDPVSGTSTPTGPPGTARSFATATLLPNGKVLIAGGQGAGTLASAELYDPVSGTFSPTGNMVAQRARATATLLSNGKVLIAGGTSFIGTDLYDPQTGAFTPGGAMHDQRWRGHTATLLPNGKVLMVGGYQGPQRFLAGVELYDPATSVFTATLPLVTARYLHTATLLPNGKVFIAGGMGFLTFAAEAELYDPGLQTQSVGSLLVPRQLHAASLLPDGRVLLVGGTDLIGQPAGAEIYDPSATSGAFSQTSDPLASRSSFSATPLPNGTVLVSGTPYTKQVELFDPHDPSPGVFAPFMWVSSPPRFITATRLPDGTVLVAGGHPSLFASDAMLFDPSGSGDFSGFLPTGALNQARDSHTATLLPDGRVLVVGGAWPDPLANAELYAPADKTFVLTGSMAEARTSHTATLLPNGSVLVVGGLGESGSLATTEVYDATTGAFTAGAMLNQKRYGHTATLLPDGDVLIVGGNDGSSTVQGQLTSAELYSAASKSFVPTGSLNSKRMGHTATLLPNGKVLFTGGIGADANVTVSAELYDPATRTFASTGSMAEPRSGHRAILLPAGKVLVVGGAYNDRAPSTLAELYDPKSGTFRPTGSMATKRLGPGAVLMGDGQVLVVGGDPGPFPGSFPLGELYR